MKLRKIEYSNFFKRHSEFFLIDNIDVDGHIVGFINSGCAYDVEMPT